MLISESSSGRSTDGSSSIRHFTFFVTYTLEVSAEARFDECPSTTILRLFLRPTLFGVREAFGSLNERFEWERSNLFNSDDSNVIMSLLLTLGLQVVVNLTTAVNDLADLVISNKVGVSITKHFVESQSFAEVFKVRVTASKLE